MTKSDLIKDKWLIIPTIILLSYLIIRLVDQAHLISTFPLDYTNDWSSYITQSHFLKVCGFHNICPYWYNGFVSFLIESPGWPFFIFPIYSIISNITAANYIGLLIILALSLMAAFKIGQTLKFSKLRSLAFFSLFFGNYMTLGAIRQGRVKTLLGFTLGLWLIYFIITYKDKKITPKFLFIIPIYAAILLSHYQEAVLFSLLPLCLLVYKKDLKERVIIILSLILSIIITLFWSYPFLLNIIQVGKANILFAIEESTKLLVQYSNMPLQTMAIYAVPIIFLSLLVIRVHTSKDYRLLKFYFPIIILAVLVLSKLNTILPIIRNIYTVPILQFILLFLIILALEIKTASTLLKALAAIGIILASLLSVSVSHIHTPYFIEYTPAEYELLDVLEKTPGHFLMLNPNSKTSYAKAYYSLAAIKYNLTTPSGWYESMAPKEHLAKLASLTDTLKIGDCGAFTNTLQELKTEYVIGYAEYCEKLSICGLKTEYTNGKACLLSFYKIWTRDNFINVQNPF